MISDAVDAVDVAAWVQAELDAIEATIPPMPTFEPLTSGLCGTRWWGEGSKKLPWSEGEGPGYVCTLAANHRGDCKNQALDGSVLASLRVKAREVRKIVPEPVKTP